jgi:hypothetical protein
VAWWFSCVCILGLLTSAIAATDPLVEYRVKAVALINFARFTEWPADAFADTNAPLVVAVLGDDPFGPILEEAIAGEVVKGRKLTVKRFAPSEPPAHCHLLFISRSEQARLGTILNGLAQRPVLTVGELERFGQRGGMINFVMEKNKVGFEINPEAAKAARLNLSSRLLGLARIVKTDPDP